MKPFVARRCARWRMARSSDARVAKGRIVSRQRATRCPKALAIHRGTCLRLLLPVASPAIRFRDIAPHTYGFEIDERLTAVIPLVTDDLFQAVAVGPHGFDLVGRGDQRFDARLPVAGIRVLHGHPDDSARLQVDRMLSANESAARHAIARSASKPSK